MEPISQEAFSYSYSALGVMSVAMAIGIFVTYAKEGSKNKSLRLFSVFFALLSLYTFLLSYFLFFDNLYFAALVYNLAIFILFLMLFIILNIVLKMIDFPKSKKDTSLSALALVASIVILIQIYYFRVPIVKEAGPVDWNANKIAAIITSLTAFCVALLWTYVIIKGTNFSDTSLKIKSYIFALGGLFLGLSCLTTYYSFEQSILLVSHAFAHIGGLLFAATLLFYRDKK